MASTNSTRTTGRLHRRHFYHWRLCRFEPLELRQLLSASTGADTLAELDNSSVGYLMLSAKTHQTAGPTGYTPDQIRQAYGFNSVSFLQPSTGASGLNLKASQLVFATNFAAGTKILSIAGNVLTLSSKATSTGTISMVFGASFNLVTTAKSHTATMVSTAGLTVGEAVGSANFGANTTITNIVNATTITLSNPATATTLPGKPVVAIIGTSSTVATVLNSPKVTLSSTTSIPGDGRKTTIAIIDPGNDPTVISDANAFSLQFGLPQFNIANGPTLKVVNQFGSASVGTLPIDDQDTSVEIALDVEWAHAVAPMANILLVEVPDPFSPFSGGALDPTFMFQGNAYARSQPNVVVISNSWGGPEGIGEAAEDSLFTTPAGHTPETFVFSAGDSGGPASYPSASPNVLSVGGTTLRISATNNWSGETVWNNIQSGGGGGGESALLLQQPGGRIFSDIPLESVPNYQSQDKSSSAGVLSTLSGRGTPDVSYDADPSTGFAVYDSFAFGAATPWDEVGGTSAGAPQWSALLAIVDQGRALSGKTSIGNAQAAVYKLPATDFHDITTGNNNFLGTIFPNQGFNLGITGNAAGPGYDLASGLGSPIANLVIRDLVAFNGSTFVTSTRVTSASTPSSGIWNFYSKPRIALGDGSADGDADGSLGVVSPAPDMGDSDAAADDANSFNQLSTADDAGALPSSAPDSLHLSDSVSLQFALDSQDDASNLVHHLHGDNSGSSDQFDAAIDAVFAEI